MRLISNCDRPAQYNPWLIEVTPGDTAYSDFHEHAHLEQHATRTWPWRMHERVAEWPVLGRMANLLVECEAAWMARREMRACRCWELADAEEAIGGLFCHLLTLTIFVE